MFKKAMLCVATLAMVFGFALANNALAGDKGPETIILKTAKARKPVLFPHRNHQARLECKTCHESAGFPKAANEWTKKLGHGLCRACHKKQKAAGAPTKCSACHKKGLK